MSIDYILNRDNTVTIENARGDKLLIEYGFELAREPEDCFLIFEALYDTNISSHQPLTTKQKDADHMLAMLGFEFTLDELLDAISEHVDMYDEWLEGQRGAAEWNADRD